LLSKRGATSHRRESAAVHSVQTSLFDLGEETDVSDHGPVMVEDVDRTYYAESDVSASKVEERSQEGKRRSLLLGLISWVKSRYALHGLSVPAENDSLR